MPDPKIFISNKDKLVSSEIRNIVESFISEKLSIWFDQNPSIVKPVLLKITTLHKQERSGKQEKVSEEKELELTGLPGNSPIVKIQKKMVQNYLLSRRPAGGSAKQGRNREFQGSITFKRKIFKHVCGKQWKKKKWEFSRRKNQNFV